MKEEVFKLVWNQFEDHTTNAFSLLYDEKDLCDVTLVTDDGETFLAHKVVLSGVSPVLKAILSGEAKSPSIFIYLSGMNGQSVDSILRFIYLGETKVKSENIKLSR